MRPFTDYHSHPQGHRHQLYAAALLQPWADAAREKGISDFAFTDHDRYHAGVNFDEVARLRDANPDLRIRAGIELDADPASGHAGRAWVERNWDRLDFVLGSVHHLSAPEMFDSTGQEGQLTNRPIDEIYADYFARVQRMAESGVVDCLSHLDLIKIHGHRPRVDVLRLVEPLLQVVRARGLALEISTAGWRKPVGEIYPEKKIVLRADELGIPFTTASDARSYAQLGENYPRLADFLAECGIKKVAIYERHHRTMLELTAEAAGGR